MLEEDLENILLRIETMEQKADLIKSLVFSKKKVPDKYIDLAVSFYSEQNDSLSHYNAGKILESQDKFSDAAWEYRRAAISAEKNYLDDKKSFKILRYSIHLERDPIILNEIASELFKRCEMYKESNECLSDIHYLMLSDKKNK